MELTSRREKLCDKPHPHSTIQKKRTAAVTAPIHAAWLAAVEAASLEWFIDSTAATGTWVAAYLYFDGMVISKTKALNANWLLSAWAANPPPGILPAPGYVFSLDEENWEYPPDCTVGFLDE